MEIAKRLEELEKDIQNLKALMLFENDLSCEKKLISLRGKKHMYYCRFNILKLLISRNQ
jgi:hypothetical protein